MMGGSTSLDLRVGVCSSGWTGRTGGWLEQALSAADRPYFPKWAWSSTFGGNGPKLIRGSP